MVVILNKSKTGVGVVFTGTGQDLYFDYALGLGWHRISTSRGEGTRTPNVPGDRQQGCQKAEDVRGAAGAPYARRPRG